MAMHQGNITAALALASAGIKIFPAGADKRPLLKGWQDAATCDADQINTWFEHAAALPAIPCGQNNLLVIDCDRHSGGADGVAAFNSLVTAHGALPRQVPVVKTAKGGLHVYFRQPNGECWAMAAVHLAFRSRAWFLAYERLEAEKSSEGLGGWTGIRSAVYQQRPQHQPHRRLDLRARGQCEEAQQTRGSVSRTPPGKSAKRPR